MPGLTMPTQDIFALLEGKNDAAAFAEISGLDPHEIDTLHNANGFSLLSYALANGCLYSSAALIVGGASLDARNGRTALSLASDSGNPAVQSLVNNPSSAAEIVSSYAMSQQPQVTQPVQPPVQVAPVVVQQASSPQASIIPSRYLCIIS